MFEDSQLSRKRERSFLRLLVSVALHMTGVAVLILVPLVYTDALSLDGLAAERLLVPPAPPPGPPPAVEIVEVERPPSPRPVVEIDPEAMIAPREIPDGIADIVDSSSAPSVEGGAASGSGFPGGVAFSRSLPGRTLAVPPPPPAPVPPELPPPPAVAEPVRVGGVVERGLIIHQPQPEYPELARRARIQGVVILEATVGVDGHVNEVRVISGPQLLQRAAAAAVEQWRYRPYTLNGEPVPITATVTVNFSMR